MWRADASGPARNLGHRDGGRPREYAGPERARCNRGANDGRETWIRGETLSPAEPRIVYREVGRRWLPLLVRRFTTVRAAAIPAAPMSPFRQDWSKPLACATAKAATARPNITRKNATKRTAMMLPGSSVGWLVEFVADPGAGTGARGSGYRLHVDDVTETVSPDDLAVRTHRCANEDEAILTALRKGRRAPGGMATCFEAHEREPCLETS